MNAEQFSALRQHMVLEIATHTVLLIDKIGRSNLDSRVMEVMAKVPRHEFVPLEIQQYAYLNRPLPIGFDKTISQPFIVALMTDLLNIEPGDTILEIGTGLGYQAAILAELAKKVYSVEIIDALAAQAQKRLERAGYKNIEIQVANGSLGWPEHAPFDKVIVTAAPDLIPTALINQLKSGGRMVIPAGLPDSQQLMLVEKDGEGRLKTQEILPVRFSVLEGTEET